MAVQRKKEPERCVEVACLLAGLATLARAMRSPFYLQHLERVGCDVQCQGGLAAACCLLHSIGGLGRPALQEWLGHRAAAWVIHLGALVADCVLVLSPQKLPALGASVLCAQMTGVLQDLVLWQASASIAAESRGELGQRDFKLVAAASRLASLAGPWLGLWLASDFVGAVSIAAKASFVLTPLLLLLPRGASAARAPENRCHSALQCLKAPQARRGMLFLLALRFFLAFAFHAFNLVLGVHLITRFRAPPWLLATVGLLSCVAGLLSERRSSLTEFAGNEQLLTQALVLISLARFTAFLAPTHLVMLLSLATVAFAAVPLDALLEQLQREVGAALRCSDLEMEGFRELTHAVEALAGVVGPLYSSSVFVKHGASTVMGGLVLMYAVLIPFAQLGIQRAMVSLPAMSDGTETPRHKHSHRE
eukprot:TRINITY_DN18120_c0_g2_i2.p1 TRINITY_DN18120_c0_g2~~TRINITY_DN18120_c0_g2_i2.p1  ORF type:complete len:437 (+),score=89.50 TRINITY_DN18120_c0_g2_i2:49-1311(+)